MDVAKWYNSLNEVDRNIVLTFTCGFAPCAITEVTNWLEQASGKKTNYPKQVVAKLVDSAVSNGFFEKDNKSNFSLASDTCSFLWGQLLKNGLLLQKLSRTRNVIFPYVGYISTWNFEQDLRRFFSSAGLFIFMDAESFDASMYLYELSTELNATSALMPKLYFEYRLRLINLIVFTESKRADRKLILSFMVEQVCAYALLFGKPIPSYGEIRNESFRKEYLSILSQIDLVNFFLKGEFQQVLDFDAKARSEESVFAAYYVAKLMGRKDLADSLFLGIKPVLADSVLLLKVKFVFFALPFLFFDGKIKVNKLPKVSKSVYNTVNPSLQYLASVLRNLMVVDGAVRVAGDVARMQENCLLMSWVKLLHRLWYTQPLEVRSRNSILASVKEESISFYYYTEMMHLLMQLIPDLENGKIVEDFRKKMGIAQLLSGVYVPPSEWEKKLMQLSALTAKPGVLVPSEERLIWLVDPEHDSVQPVLQKLQKNGAWSKGRNVSLTKLAEEGGAFVTEYDRKVINQLKLESSYYGARYEFSDDVLLSLVGHPYMFLQSAPEIPISFEAEEIYLVVEEVGAHCVFSYSHPVRTNPTANKVSPNKYLITYATPSILQVQQILGDTGIKVPKSATDQVLNALKSLSGLVKIQSPLMGEKTGSERVEPSLRLFVHLLPVGNGIRAEIFVKPFGELPPCLSPGTGLVRVNTMDAGKHFFTDRNLKAEQKQFMRMMELCPILASQAEVEMMAFFDEPTDCLAVLAELRAVEDFVTVEWPKGQRIALRGKLSAANFSVSVKKKNNWFDVKGELTVNAQEVIDLKKMLDLLDNAKGDFVEIEPGVFVELERHFVRQLEYLKSVLDVGAKSMKLNPLAAIAGSNLFDSAGNFESDKEWNSFVKKIKKADKASYPVPKWLEADLRPYQEEGYKWLRKMADWGTGACLADDMGLGKTIQCLALLVSRESLGPSMVIAPSSVCRNWMAETQRFAPGLVPVLFGTGDRKQAVESLESGALLVVSYGLLSTEAELLASREWNTLILDEAHAIKNIGTKRAQAALSIPAAFRIAATGTPLQNHMGEIWNLFQFLNPGLLGSQKNFSERFVLPIERNNSELARRTLKELIRPFMLRRTKNQVLSDLPDKTEITLAVEMSDQERVFYEALRLKALADLQKMDDTSNAGEKQLRVFAEIMRLRRACCHPSLVNKAVDISSAKLQRFEELVDDLLDNGHKALVFSQFVDHLRLIRELLDRKGIPYEYLDGSTSGKEREERIKRYQGGSTDLFLISLKAGGVGLNLTAADYVIHMDPWWNPAVEDQASDRAHRIGQTKPVTIYRLVAKDTIEERIVDLHKDKRDLADSLLEGSEGAAKVTANDLVSLLANM